MAIKKQAAPKVHVTKNYRLFERSQDNRQVSANKHKRLKKSMERYGFLEAFPIVCVRNGQRRLVVRDGQHRLLFAESLGLSVYYIVTDQEFDIADINNAARNWAITDYAENFAEKGIDSYQELLSFCDIHNIPVSLGASLLGSTTTFSNISNAFYAGDFKVVDREWANKVAGMYSSLLRIDKGVKSRRLVEACMAACRVDSFSPKRLLQNAERCRDKLASYSTREGNLEMLEDIYNFGRKSLLGLKAEALMAMRERNAVNRNGSPKTT